MSNYKNSEFIKRVRVKGHVRVTRDGKMARVEPHYRVVKSLRSEITNQPIRRKLI